ncbi:MAG TPA: YfhO family protein [Mycobacteriales bacterium]|nr:YfhO family protein [Mycobacteriales bacterium]
MVGPPPRQPAAGRVISRLRSSFPLTAALVIGAIVVLNFLPVFAGQVPLAIDIILQSPIYDGVREAHPVNLNHADLGDLVAGFYPLHDYAADAVRGGDFPLWNRHLLLGQPYLAIYQPAALYPPNLLYFLLPTPLAWALLYPLRMFLAAWFTALFVRALGGSRTASIVAGLSFGFAGFMLSWSGWPHVDVAVWLPLICLAVQRLREQATPIWGAVLASAVGATLLAGHPQTALYVLTMGGLFALHRLVFGSRRVDDLQGETAEADAPRGRYVAWLAVGGLIGVGIAMVQLLPTAEWIGLTTRSGQDRSGHLAPSQILGLLSRDTRNSPNGAGIGIPEAATYVGMLALLGAAMSVLSRRRRDVVLFAGTAVFAALVAYGVGPAYDLSLRLPAFSTLPNWRGIVLMQFALAVLAGLGVTALQRKLPGRFVDASWWAPLAAGVLAGALGIRALQSRVPLIPERVTWFRGPTSSAVVFAIAALLLTPVVVRRLRRTAVLSVLLIGFAAADLITYGYGHAPYIPPRSAYPASPVLEKLQQLDPGLYRIGAVDSAYAKNLELVYGEETPTGTGYQIKAVDPILDGFGSALSGYLYRGAAVAARAADARLDLVNLKYLVSSDYNGGTAALASRPDQFRLVLSEGHTQVFENLRVLPRAFVVGQPGVQYVGTDAEAYRNVTDQAFDPRKRLIVTDASGRDRPDVLTSQGTLTPAADVAYDINDIDVTLTAGSAGVLAISDAWFPGWQVTVDGERRELLRVNGAFKGVAVRPGETSVRFSYEPASFSRGRKISLVSLALLVGILGLSAVQRRRNRSRSGGRDGDRSRSSGRSGLTA